MKRFLKILGVSFLSLAIVVASCFIPLKLKQSENSLNKASAASILPPGSTFPDYTINTGTTFFGSNVVTLFPACISENRLVTDFSDYLYTNGGFNIGIYGAFSYSFTLSFSLEQFQFGYRAVRNSSNYVVSNTSNAPNSSDVPINLINFSEFSLSQLQSTFTPDSIYNSSVVTPMQITKLFDNDVSLTKYTNFGIAIYKNNLDVDTFVQPTLEMISLEILNSYQFEYYFGYEPHFPNSNILIYTDTVGYKYFIYIPSMASDAGSIPFSFQYLSYRKYYFESAFDFDNNDYYEQGVADGFNEGYDVGENDGYNYGYSTGLNVGKNLGYNEGLEANSRLTFTGLMTSVIDVPVKVFISLFDFNILGVNILVFLSTLLTICLVLFLIKKIKGA